ncbi:GHKL domain-containing protein [Bacillus sp. JCM 19041]|uniref:sensor histidine kinase n=1 Tax=Bacillus sp. JCM 19041 TaxID=1460637 RepID=UPI0006CF8720
MFLIDFIGAFLETIPLLMIVLQLLNRIHIDKKSLIYLFFLSIVTSLFLTISFNNPLFKLPLIVLVLATLISHVYNAKFFFSLLSLLFSMTFLLIVELLNINFLSPFLKDITPSTDNRFITASINGLILLLIFITLRKLNSSLIPKYDINHVANPKFWWLLPVFIVLFMLIATEIIQDDLTTTSSYLIITASVAFIYFMKQIIYKKNVEAEKIMLHEQEKNAKAYLRSIQAQRHDFIYQINTINSLVHLERINDLKTYLSELTEEFQTTSETLPLHYISTAGLLIQYKQIFKKDGVKLNIEVEDSFKGLPMPVYEFNNIIGNLITNAFESIISQEDCSTVITIKFFKDQHLIVKVLNEVNPESLKLNNILQDGYSTKKNSIEHGLGLNNAIITLERYSGYLYPELHDQKLSMFVILPAKERNENNGHS